MGLKSWLIGLGAKDEPESLQRYADMINAQWEARLQSTPNGRVPVAGVCALILSSSGTN